MKARTFAWSFLPGEASTPLVTSTAYGRTWRTASSTLSGVRPPARMTGPSTWACAARSQSIVTPVPPDWDRSEEHTSELQSLTNLVCRLLLEKKNTKKTRKPSERAQL